MYCKECGSQIGADDLYCDNCGAPIHQTKTEDASNRKNEIEPKPGSTGRKIAAGLIAAMAALGCIAAGYFGWSHFSDQQPDESVWKAAYKQVLSDNEKGIRDYEHLYSHGDYSQEEYDDRDRRATALCDVDNDGVPELFLMISPETDGFPYYALKVFDCNKDGEAYEVKVDYSWPYPDEADEDEGIGYTGSTLDSMTQEIIFTEKNRTGITIYSLPADAMEFFTAISRHEPTQEGILSQTKSEGYESEAVFEDGPFSGKADLDSAKFYQDGEAITQDEYMSFYEEVRDNMDQVIFISNHQPGADDGSIWERAYESENLGKTYDEMTTYLSE